MKRLGLVANWGVVFGLVAVALILYPMIFWKQKAYPSAFRENELLRSAWPRFRNGQTNVLSEDRQLILLRDQDGESLLHYAARDGVVERVELLLAAGADPNSRDHIGTTPLMLAASYGHYDVATALLKAGANPLIESGGANALIDAVRAAQLSKSAPPDYFPKDYQNGMISPTVFETAAFYSVSVKRTEADYVKVVELLLEAGVPTDSRTREGLSALEIASRNELTKIVDLLESRLKQPGIKQNSQN